MALVVRGVIRGIVAPRRGDNPFGCNGATGWGGIKGEKEGRLSEPGLTPLRPPPAAAVMGVSAAAARLLDLAGS